jgi:hypothetical protein
MKTQNKIRAAGLLLLAFVFQFSFASNIGGSIMGQVTDPDTKEPVSFASVIFENQGTQKVFVTNESGYYYASNIPAGVYNITATYMSKHITLENYKLSNDENKTLDIQIGLAVDMGGVEIFTTSTRGSIVDPIDPQKDILIRDEIRRMPITSVVDIAGLKSGVVKSNGEYYVRGSRAGGLSYYIDGCRVMGNPDIPLCGLDTYRLYNGFIPPKYGDALGGVVVMETRNYFSEQ